MYNQGLFKDTMFNLSFFIYCSWNRYSWMALCWFAMQVLLMVVMMVNIQIVDTQRQNLEGRAQRIRRVRHT